VVAVALGHRQLGERVDLGVGEPRAREAVPRRLEDAIASARDDQAVDAGDDGADRDRPGEVRLPRQVEGGPPGLGEVVAAVHVSMVRGRSHAVHEPVDLPKKLPLGAELPSPAAPSGAPARMRDSPANGRKRPVHNRHANI
jgi:hypothetical protein